jgi:putative acetyltransferase
VDTGVNVIGQVAVRPYRAGDAGSLVQIFFAAVHELGRVKYDEAQIRAWAPCIPAPSEWEARMRLNETFVAERNTDLVGFIELERDGHLSMLYRSPGISGSGVTEALYRVVETRARELGIPKIRTEASLLAESFFARHGYSLDLRESVERNGVFLPRVRMSKVLE